MDTDTHGCGKPRWWGLGGNFAWAASLFLTGLGAKLGLILYHGLAFPYWDQWPGEAQEMIIPFLAGKPVWSILFTPHNEHRIFFTRALDLILLQLNGQWDSLLTLTCSAVFFCAGMAGIGWVLASLLGKRSWPLIWILLAVDLALPFAWENTLWAFQSQFYFLIVFSLLTIWLLGLHEPWSWRWWLGIVTAAAASLSMASGFFAAAVVAAMGLLKMLKEPAGWRRQMPTWVVCAAIVLIGLHFRVEGPASELHQAHSARDFLLALGKNLAWPWAIYAWYAPIALAPLVALAWVCWRSPNPPKPAALMIFGIAGWVGLQALATAFARGNGGSPPAFRYMDHLGLLAMVNGLAIYVLVTETNWRTRRPFLFYGATAVWVAGYVSGLWFLTAKVNHQFIPEIEAEQALRQASARAFMATDDPAVFLNEPEVNRPVPDAAADIAILREPHLRAVLPVCVREPLRIAPVTNGDDTFVRNGWLMNEADAPTERSWGSYSAKKEAAQGVFETQPMAASALPYLSIAVAGDLGGAGLSLELVELKSGRVTEVTPPSVPHGAWVEVQVRAPEGAFKLVARDESATGWFAFKEPVEMGRLSVWALRVLAGWEILAVAGGGLFLLNVARLRRGKTRINAN